MAWAAAVVLRERQRLDQSLRLGEASAPYVPGLVASPIGSVREAAVRGLTVRPDALLVDATGSDHPRKARLVTQLGAVLKLPTVGVTHRPLTGEGPWPGSPTRSSRCTPRP
jgi:deoxyribonuclease V